MFNDADAQSPFRRSANLGFRCVKYSSLDALSKTVTGPVTLAARSYEREQPVSEEVFRVFLSLYSYDRTALNSAIESLHESDENWKQQTTSFAPAYGKERALANLFLPKKFAPPYQTLIYFPGTDPVPSRISEYDMRLIEFVIRSGRAVLCPVFKGFLKSDLPDMTSAYRDYVINLSKELNRGIDYLETRPDIDHAKIGYYGFSWGAAMGAILPALEPRLKVSILHGGGFYQQKTRPEVDQINFAPRVTIPVLMLNGRYDFFFPKETSQDSMFRLLGTPKEHKRHAVFECGHVIPRNEIIKETLSWLDRYLGPVEHAVTRSNDKTHD
jgi:eukaryotic-like serine/threonine-protein kinase